MAAGAGQRSACEPEQSRLTSAAICAELEQEVGSGGVGGAKLPTIAKKRLDPFASGRRLLVQERPFLPRFRTRAASANQPLILGPSGKHPLGGGCSS